MQGTAKRGAGLGAELATALRFVAVGALNTAIGYGFILGGLLLGLGDYAANLCGFVLSVPVSYLTHRWLTFRARHRASRAEMLRYALVFALAYLANLAVIAIGREVGMAQGIAGQALVQAGAVGTYAVVLFVLSRLIVFPSRRG
ncbi:GtrA family protein [Novosphingobium sp. YJ-S2-02]|uniref:GtrA family protein n=1 Tax=Novosphingobium aureum TaxID=2792964 RepID=A0A931HE54_9SPHN|nr:GtrA family protein [Novosphingobium aureum]MBH0113721.1 GtrA family protein [Novosphingobium aureum]